VKRQLLTVFVAVATGLDMPYLASADLIFDSSHGRVESESVQRSGGADVRSNVGLHLGERRHDERGLGEDRRFTDAGHGRSVKRGLRTHPKSPSSSTRTSPAEILLRSPAYS